MPTAPRLDSELADLLAGYRSVLRFTDTPIRACRVRAGDGRWLRHVPLLVTTAFLRPIVAAHARRSMAELERGLHFEAATSGADHDATLDALAHFRQSLPDIPVKRYTVWFLGAVLAGSLIVSNLMRALAPTELDQASHAMGDLAGAIVTVDTSGLADGIQRFSVGSATAAAVLITLSLYVVALVPLGSFRLKRILFNHHPACRADVTAAIAARERRCATGLYECEARVFAAHGLPAPNERPVDLAASAILAGFPLLLGFAALVSPELRHVFNRADEDLVNFVLVPAGLFVLLVLPLASLYRLSDIYMDRRANRPEIRIFTAAELAGTPRRVAALTLDWMLAWLPVIVLLTVLVSIFGDDTPVAAFYFVVMPVSYALAVLPFMLRPGPRRGQSLGKQLMGIRVVDAEGDRLRSSQIVVRELVVKSLVLFGISLLLAYIPLIVDLVMTVRDPQRRAIEDRVATTRVVRAGVPARAPEAEPERVLVAA